jgi:hypothetical protein
LTHRVPGRNLKSMRCFIFPAILIAAMTGTAGIGAAQVVPGRDLLELPLATVAEAPVLATFAGDGLWNPATIFLRNGARLRISAASLEGPRDQGLSAQLLALAYAIRPRTTLGLAVSRAAVSDLVRTEDDPQSVGGEIPYNTIVGSATIARRTNAYLTAGVSVRYRHGELDNDRSGAIGIDGGVVADALPWQDARVAASTFLWRPASDASERTRYSVGGDLRVAGADSLLEARVGYATAYTEQLSREHYAFVGGRYKAVEGRAGAVRLSSYGNVDWRFRVGIGVHHARYAVGVAREETGAGLRPTYAFTLTSTRH